MPLFASRMRAIALSWLLGLVLGSASATVGAAQVGAVKVASGVVTAQAPGGSPRLLARGATLQEGDVLSTASRSFAVLEMQDGSRMTVRPRTVLELEQYSVEPKKENAVLRLFRGGLRAITGFISKRNSNAFKIRTPVATIGIRGTAFEARLCDDNCAKERKRKRKRSRRVAQDGATVAARVVFMRGDARADRGAGRPRQLSLGASLYEGDTIATNARALVVLSFKDGTRVTVVPESSFKIEQMTFEEKKPEKDSLFLRLLRGGVRAVSGLIAERSRRNVRFRAGTATIGIRGTGLDIVCDGPCGENETAALIPMSPIEQHVGAVLNNLIPPAYAADGRIFVHFFSGSGTLTSGGQTISIATGGTGFVPGLGLLPQIFTGVAPKVLQELQGAPDPGNDENLDPEIREQLNELFEVGELGDGDVVDEGTLIVLVDEGDVSVGGVFLGEGEGVVAGDDGGLVRVLTPDLQIVRLPPPNVLEQNSDLIDSLGNSVEIEFNEEGKMCIGL